MDNIVIKYGFKLPDETREDYVLTIDGNTLELIRSETSVSPDWARLDFCQCSNCSLDIAIHPYCPLMVNLTEIVKGFDRILSYDEVLLKVVTEERYVVQKTTAQRALSSLMGLIIAASACPHTVFFKPMARFHLPLANSDETMYRAASTYLLAEYFRKKSSNTKNSFDITGLGSIYKDMQIVNAAIADRLRSASTSDSSVNAIVLLDMYAKAVPYFIVESMEEIEYLFAAYVNSFTQLSEE